MCKDKPRKSRQIPMIVRSGNQGLQLATLLSRLKGDAKPGS